MEEQKVQDVQLQSTETVELPNANSIADEICFDDEILLNNENDQTEEAAAYREDHSKCDWLEQSWRGLANFNHSHIGRICAGDEMETLMELVKQLSVVKDDEEDFFENTNSDFIIPELPRGTKLTFHIKSTWGDPHYVGLNGIETFSENGELATVSSISADPCDMRSLPEYANDPRVVNNLVDGIYKTRDDTHLWLTPLSSNKDNTICVHLEHETSIAMIRIWNYNKSRIHSFRGVRHMQIFLDDVPIFNGEISKAPGVQDTDVENLSDTILFTTDEEILQRISLNDSSFMSISVSPSCNATLDEQERQSTENEHRRPATGDKSSVKPLKKPQHDEPCLKHMLSMEGENVVVKARSFTIQIVENWGMTEFLGLTGFQIINREGNSQMITSKMLSSSIPCLTLDRMTNERNVTVDDNDMWLIRWDGSSRVSIHVRFPDKVAAMGFRFWNFNKSLEMSYAGAKFINIYADDELVLSNVLLRKAPGNLHYNFEQEVFFGSLVAASTTQQEQANEATVTRGFVYQLQLLSTWGDEFYMGLNGLELYDKDNEPLKLSLKNVAAYPESVNVLPDVQYDVRSSDKLIDGINDTVDVSHMWLTPVIPNLLNRIYVIFDEPTSVNRLKLWNYSKPPLNRGIRDFILLVDDIIIFTGELPCSDETHVGHFDLCLTEIE